MKKMPQSTRDAIRKAQKILNEVFAAERRRGLICYVNEVKTRPNTLVRDRGLMAVNAGYVAPAAQGITSDGGHYRYFKHLLTLEFTANQALACDDLENRVRSSRPNMDFSGLAAAPGTISYMRVDLPEGHGGPQPGMIVDTIVPPEGGPPRCRVNTPMLILAKIADVGDRPPHAGRPHLESVFRQACDMHRIGSITLFDLVEFRLTIYGDTMAELQALFGPVGVCFSPDDRAKLIEHWRAAKSLARRYMDRAMTPVTGDQSMRRAEADAALHTLLQGLRDPDVGRLLADFKKVRAGI